MTRQHDWQTVATRAGDILSGGCHCSEAVFWAVGEHLLREIHPQSKRMATLFGGGVGGCREELCGALSGAILAMSALLGRSECGLDDKAEMALAKAFRERFGAEFGHTICKPLRDRFNPDGQGSCRPLVERTVRLLLEFLAEANRIER